MLFTCIARLRQSAASRLQRVRFGGTKSLAAIVPLALGALSTEASANCWGVAESTVELMRQELRLESNNGPVTSVVSYRVVFSQEVCESGGFELGGTIDKRVCTSHGRSRKFIREITVTPREGTPITLGKTEKLMDAGRAIPENGPCTDHAKNLTDRGKALRTGTAATWANEIEKDQSDVDKTLKLVGQITEKKIVFTL